MKMREIILESPSLREIIKELLISVDPDYPCVESGQLPRCIDLLVHALMYHCFMDTSRAVNNPALDARLKRYIRRLRRMFEKEALLIEALPRDKWFELADSICGIEVLNVDGTFRLTMLPPTN